MKNKTGDKYMIKVERIEVSGLANALYGMRLPKLSNKNSDTKCFVYDYDDNSLKTISLNDVSSDTQVINTYIGEKDKKLGKSLILAGTDHGKWLRQCSVSVLITAPMTFWWDFDTYKVATVKNSSSRMHKITSRNLIASDISWDNENGELILTPFREMQLLHLNELIDKYNNASTPEHEKIELFRQIIQDLPEGYNFTATWTGSAQTCRNYYFARRKHKQKELRDLADIFGNLPTIGEFITCEGGNK
jgi:hypothetical protein